ncbi:unnamed protein product [Meganyctiphanes norvegica]|uniref:Nucleoredoxin n=1 Tax=Meganyctiphanes norvegica TaxID=48144 RepID=A0AAV2PRH0_MEGNR
MKMAHPNIVKWLGTNLVGHSGPVDVNNICGPDKIIALYFSANWCPPCRNFTPQLVAIYKHLKENTKQQLEVVLVSSDQDDQAFQDYYRDMPWLALPYQDSKRKLRLSRRFRVASIPSLVLLDSRSGRVITRTATEKVVSDPEGLEFPWRPRSLDDVLSTASLVDNTGQVKPYDNIRDGYKGLYFSAHWCPPCKAFTPQLVSAYEKIRKRGEKFEIIFISSDRSEDSFSSYHATMPWLAVSWEQDELRRQLASLNEVQGIPTLVILGPDSQSITTDARALVGEDPDVQGFPWVQQSVEILEERHMARLQESPCLLLFTDGESAELQFARDVLLPVAEEYLLENQQEGGMQLAFYVAGEDEMSDNVRDFACLEDVVPLVAILDLAEGVKYILEHDVEVSTATVHNFLTRYTKDKLESQPLSKCNAEEATGDS